ncbi:hypothetical protein [Aeromicrobium sp. UC242_57]|uniref:hypothetical protein n=1 Tax=Aeromicrobium sp. UC242_57 TaxID=3374624 RepID=UPI00379DD261
MYNPDEGFIVTANNKVIGDQYPAARRRHGCRLPVGADPRADRGQGQAERPGHVGAAERLLQPVGSDAGARAARREAGRQVLPPGAGHPEGLGLPAGRGLVGRGVLQRGVEQPADRHLPRPAAAGGLARWASAGSASWARSSTTRTASGGTTSRRRCGETRDEILAQAMRDARDGRR